MRVAILGDSYISGEGAKEYISHTDAFAPGGSANNCHRSVLSWAYQIAAELVGPHRIGNAGVGNTDPDGDVLFVACSGATTDDMRMENPKAGGEHQLNALRAFEQGHPTDIVFLSIGGNDAGFADAIELCLTGDCLKDDFVNIQLALADEVETRVEQLVRDIRAIAPRATVYIVGYPDPLRPTPQNCARVGVPEGIDEDIADVPVVGQAAADLIAGGRIDDDEQAWVSQGFLPELNDAVERGAVSAGAVVLAEVEAAFTGHGVCSEEPFAWGVMPGEDVPALAADYGVGILGRESFHPTADGYRRLQDVLRAALVETDPTTSSLQK